MDLSNKLKFIIPLLRLSAHHPSIMTAFMMVWKRKKRGGLAMMTERIDDSADCDEELMSIVVI